ncbi:MAG: rRNA maturation RNase YbeY [Geminicoccaceae bacterium]|nr:rRNA maturation RNase YbeY [Geminicoccaceae bacterium]MCS7268794.1 rRNA maturation RNase YbeY [Geminicoccaceae bacterium]MCX7630879.1 rRNA maturation RNase YbeY [Geminicoccaceae bacterium]MDW8125873.1 rRNA maturation RNase YbeY [Geminicoccaceae bacterium]MDW8340506.1 rRNA maturation RNase YbeY [Geminicoccaceae bacterium]
MDGDGSPNSVEVVVEAEPWRSVLSDPEALCRRAVETAIGLVVGRGEIGPVTVLLTDDARIRALNRSWRGEDSATDVLSFPSGPRPPGLPAEEPWPLGDIAVAFETAARDARGSGRPLSDHLAHLLVHGTLHLLGFDHEEPEEAERMEALERRILAALGIEPAPTEEPIAAPETAP